MAKIIESVLTCPFCNCKFIVEKDEIQIIKVYSAVGYDHHDVFKILKCPLCGENVKEKFLRAEGL
jgi:rubrerythrin